MKPILTFLIALITVATTLAQQGINYKAVIKDDKGNVITNQKIIVEFNILLGEAKSSMYIETHTPTTDANGTIILTIGKGISTDGDFSLIKWGNNEHYLQTRIDTGNGLIDIGTTTFNAVPYAFQAQTANMAMNVSGLETIDEGNGIGWRFIGRDPAYYGNIGNNAVDLSYSTNSSTPYGALGNYSFAIGILARATGNSSIALGKYTLASGPNSIAMGFSTEATGNLSTAFGYLTQASGSLSTSLGNFTKATSFVETALGQYNTNYTPNGSTFWHNQDRLFVVGNGTSSTSKSNAITVYKNGNIAIGNITPSSSTTENVLDVSGRINLRPKTGSGSTSGIWYTDVGGVKRQFAGAKTHSLLASNRQWGVYMSGWKFWINGNGNVYVNGSLAHSSDRRLKRDIADLPYGLNEILQLQPKHYFWKDKPEQEQTSLGLIAQDVQKVIANVVHKGTDNNKTLSLSYTELIPVLINAIKEQQLIIDNQKKENLLQRVEINQLQSLNIRVEQLEALLKTKEL